MRMMRCKVPITVSCTIEHRFPAVLLQRGMEVDLDRELYAGFTLGDAVDPDHFEPVLPDLSDAMRDPHAVAQHPHVAAVDQEG